MMFLIPAIITVLVMAWAFEEMSDSWGLSFFVGIIVSLFSWMVYFALRTFGLI